MDLASYPDPFRIRRSGIARSEGLKMRRPTAGSKSYGDSCCKPNDSQQNGSDGRNRPILSERNS